MKIITIDDAIAMTHALDDLLNRCAEFQNKCGHGPAESSTKFIEYSNPQYGRYVKNAYARGHTLIESAADHAWAFIKTVSCPEPLCFANWTCARAVLEAAAYAIWLLDIDIDVSERVSRSFIDRYEGLIERKKYDRSCGRQKDVEDAELLLKNIEQEAIELGFRIVKNPKDKGIDTTIKMPNKVDMIGKMLNKEASYRLMSGMAHSQQWAIINCSRRKKDADIKVNQDDKTINPEILVEKELRPAIVKSLSHEIAYSFSRSVWNECYLYGWDVKLLSEILETAFDNLKMREDDRFWGKPNKV